MSQTDTLVGKVLDGRYEIQRRIDRGGMATVYVAFDNRLARTVAIKIMHEGLGSDRDFADRFDREARSSARLSHPNVVSVFDQGSDDGRPYIVMEYIQGCTLRSLIAQEAPMPPGRALQLLEPVAAALAAAHEAGLIHRDVKPENVLIAERGHVKVADFGLAKAVTAQSTTAAQGLVIGTVSYIAPELVTSGVPDTRADVYSFGIMAYEMLTGVKPHTGDSPIQVAYAHVHNIVPPPSEFSKAGRRIPDYVDALVTTATDRDPNARPRDGRVLLEHVKTAREALKRGIGNDAGLVAHMQMTKPLSTDNTAVLPVTKALTTNARTPSESSLPILVGNQKPPPPPVARKSRVLPIMLAVLLVLSLSGVGWYYLVGRYVDTPKLLELTEADAKTKAGELGLTVVFNQEHSETAPVGTVARTQPGPGERVLRSGEVAAWLSLGPERFAVPVVTGISEAQATQAVTETHLKVGQVTSDYHDSVPPGSVISCSPEAGTQVKRDAPINLVISRGPAPVTLVDFTGKSAGEAKDKLAAMGLKVKANEEHSDSVPKGNVISQSPASGEGKRGDTVAIVVSKGPVLVKVPNVKGRGSSEAKRILEDVGFRVVIKQSLFGLGIVGSQDPGAGETIPKGSTVTLTVA